MNNPDIVIPTKNEQNYIGNILYGLNRQYRPNPDSKINVIIADADSTDKTLFVIDTIRGDLPNLNISIVEGGTVSVGRNQGFKHTTANYVIFIDADVRLFDDYTLINTVVALNKNRLVTCKLKDYSGSFFAKLAFSMYNKIHKLLILKYPFAIGAYFAIHRSDFVLFGMFNQNSDNSEDFLFSQNYKPNEFKVLDNYIGQDNRRFKKTGYIGMGRHLIVNLIQYIFNDRTEFSKKSNYWN